MDSKSPLCEAIQTDTPASKRSASKPYSEQASKFTGQRASKPASQRASKPASQQAINQQPTSRRGPAAGAKP